MSRTLALLMLLPACCWCRCHDTAADDGGFADASSHDEVAVSCVFVEEPAAPCPPAAAPEAPSRREPARHAETRGPERQERLVEARSRPESARPAESRERPAEVVRAARRAAADRDEERPRRGR